MMPGDSELGRRLSEASGRRVEQHSNLKEPEGGWFHVWRIVIWLGRGDINISVTVCNRDNISPSHMSKPTPFNLNSYK